KDDHAAHDEARVFAALEHDREVVERRVWVRSPGRFDPRRDRVVVAIGLAVVAQSAALERVLRMRERDRLPGGRDLGGDLERIQRRTGVTIGAGGEEVERLGQDATGLADLAAGHRTVEQYPDVLRRQWL